MAEKEGESLIHEAREQFEESESATLFNRQDAYEDIVFARLANQWPEKIKKQREAEGRPCLTINRCLPYIRQIVNEARKNTPAIKVVPADSDADVNTAEVINGLIRAIQHGKRKADVAYDTAVDHAVSGGFGFFRIGIDYVNSEAFDMECYIDRIPNPLQVHWDPSTTEFDSSDWDYAFVSDWWTEEKFEKKYPGAQRVSFDGDTREATTSLWVDEERIRIAEYFTRSERKRKIYRLSDGNVVRDDALPDIAKKFFMSGGIDLGGQVKDEEVVAQFLAVNGLEITRTREAAYHEVKRRVISGVEVLEEDDWPGSVIPICPVWGDEVIIDGRRHYRSLIRDAKDPQMMFNFWRTAATELVALAPRAPFIGPKGFVPKGQEEQWATANTRSWPYLEYDSTAGNMPQRQPFAGVPAGAIQEALNSSDDMKAITGIFDSSIGAESNEKSGRAILARERQSNTSNYHFLDNLNRAIEAAGNILVEIIPYVYSERQAIRILGEDQKERVVRLMGQAGGPQEENADGGPELYNLSVGRYDVKVEASVDYSTARQETRETLMEIVSRQPDAAMLLGDIILESMDFPQHEKAARRLQAMLPPQVKAAEGIAQPNPAPQAGMVPMQRSGQPPAQPGIPAGQPRGNGGNPA